MATDNKTWSVNGPRKSANIVKCPHCSRTMSARGLYPHIRLSHPGITQKPKTSTRIVVHPYDVRGVSRHIDTINVIKSKAPKVDPWIAMLSLLIEKVIVQQFAKHKIPMQSEFKNSHKAIGSIASKKK